MLNLKKSEVSEEGVITTVYEAQHTRPGREGTTLRLDLVVTQDPRFDRTKAKIVIEPQIEAIDAEAALDKLADWAERLAIAIRHRGQPANLVPVFNQPIAPPRPEEPSEADEE